MATIHDKKEARVRRHKRIRAKIIGTEVRPRLSVFKSNRYISAQLVDDTKGVTLASVTSAKVKGQTMKEKAGEVGREIAKEATKKKVKSVVFDRGGFMYTGVIRKVAEGAREAGLAF